ncbi:hypothetical protein J4H86_25100 [Spiractinospora alimapuensis]|uniref:hypothetical protein n=1 Tax=Spiractinospora alimapuensis TaxID=2820884 RepID=UPI001F36E116|nr:hypothetical protein [Spiractinospora alimapuensis]QVQ51976.1 hypothetical protein J4H86_25100 [Spiractinospora alimapuensis]
MDPQSEGMKSLTISLIEAYVERDADGVEERSAAILRDGVDAALSDLKVFAAFLARRVQETGLAWRPSDSREAVARAVADMLPPEIELAVVSAWEAHALGEEEAAEQFTRGDPQIRLHMLAAFCAAIGQAVYEPAELISTLRLAAGL